MESQEFLADEVHSIYSFTSVLKRLIAVKKLTANCLVMFQKDD